LKRLINLFNKMIEAKKKENENLNKLKGQMKDMSQDFEDMKNARIASKQRLEQRFINIYKYRLSSAF